jgi:CSLREA domain-containing protein
MSRQRHCLNLCNRLIFIGILMVVVAGANPVQAATLTVDTLLDENDHSCSDGDCSLRDAVEVSSPGDTINFSVTGTITLNGTYIHIDKDLIISGPGASNLTIDGDDSSQVFSIAQFVSITISDLTFTGGNYLYGGAISNSGELTVNNCVFTGNQ